MGTAIVIVRVSNEEQALTPALQPGDANGVADRVPRPRSMTVAELLELVLGSLDDSKSEDIVAIDITAKTPLCDHMVVASGRSHRHVGAIAERLITDIKREGGQARVEGLPHSDWVLVDAGDVIVHVFRPEVRNFYNLEKMWQADVIQSRVGGA